MMKKIILITVAVFAFNLTPLNAQTDYKFAAGLGIDFGSGFTLVGPSAKYFLAEEHAVQAEIMFETGVTVITALYEYHGPIEGANGLKWFAGAGPSILFGNTGDAELALRPTVGLDYKIDGVPLAFSFDWRPLIGLGDGIGNEVGAFGLGFRYVLN